MPWWVASLIANAFVILSEYIHTTTPKGTPWTSIAWKVVPVYLIGQICLYRAFNGAPHWLIGWAVFTIGNNGMRLFAVNTFMAGTVGNWWLVSLGSTVMVAGAFLMKEGLKT